MISSSSSSVSSTLLNLRRPNVGNRNLQVYKDDANKFQISIPQDWQVATGEPNGFKSVTAFYPEEQSSATTNVSVVITGLGPDFTKMESFGKVEAFAETLVGGLDRSWQRPPGVAAKLIDCKASKGLYFIDYSLQNPGESLKHLYTAIGMATNGWYNRLYTVTGTFVDEESSQSYGSKIQKVVSSFKFT
ncbi:PsbP domain-containing protein 3, chloroplastic [Linum grandiflorum]